MDSQEYLAAPVVVAVPAEVDATNAVQLRAALLAVAGRCPAVVVDMSRTLFCDIAGIGVLAQARNRAMAGSGEVRLVIVSVSVLRIFALTGHDQLFPIFPSLADALADGPGPPGAPEQLGTR
jgi:anti-sigma B factor antagonist